MRIYASTRTPSSPFKIICTFPTQINSLQISQYKQSRIKSVLGDRGKPQYQCQATLIRQKSHSTISSLPHNHTPPRPLLQLQSPTTSHASRQNLFGLIAPRPLRVHLRASRNIYRQVLSQEVCEWRDQRRGRLLGERPGRLHRSERKSKVGFSSHLSPIHVF